MGIYNVPKIIQEVYFGKTLGLKKLQEQFTKFRSKYMDQKIPFNNMVNVDSDLLKFNRMVEDEFGFGTFNLYILQDMYHTAYTLPISNVVGKNKIQDNIVSSDSGFKLNKEKKYTTMVVVSTGLLFDPEFTDAEIIAILLHEIGHNFSPAIDKHTNVFYVILTAISVVHFIEDMVLLVLAPLVFLHRIVRNMLSLTFVKNYLINFNLERRKKDKSKVKVADTIVALVNGYSSIGREVRNATNILKFITKGPIALTEALGKAISNVVSKMTPMEILSTILGYNGERISDNFATVYGYGAELSSGLAKLELSHGGSPTNKLVEKAPLINNFYKLMTLPMEILWTGLDCHPNTVSRINQQLVYLEKELDKDDIDPKMRSAIKENIKEVRKALDENIYTPAQRKTIENLKDPHLVQRFYFMTVHTLCGGDIRDIPNIIDNNEQMDDAYEKNKKE